MPLPRTPKLLHIDIDPTSIRKNVDVDVCPLWAIAAKPSRAFSKSAKTVMRTRTGKRIIPPGLTKSGNGKKASPLVGKRAKRSSPSRSSKPARPDKRRGCRGHRSRPAPDVGRAVLFFQGAPHFSPAADSAPWATVFRPPSAPSLPCRQKGHSRCRRRLNPDEYPGTCHSRCQQVASQGRHSQQRTPRHGSPMAGAFSTKGNYSQTNMEAQPGFL